MTPNDLEEWEPDMTAAEFDIYSKYARLIVTTFAPSDGSRDGYDLWGNRTGRRYRGIQCTSKCAPSHRDGK